MATPEPGSADTEGTVVVVGRDAERTRVEQLLDRVADGPAGLALEGTPGIGKTTIWREGVAAARECGYTVLATAPAEADSALAFAGLGDLFDGLPEPVLGRLSGPQRKALASALLAGDSEDGQAPPDPQALPRATLNVLRELASEGPVLVAIDDEQWLDRPSARVLAFALCRLRDVQVRVLLSRRPASDGALWPELARGFGDEGLPVVVLRPLDVDAIARLIAAQLERPPSAPLVRRIHEASGGNPLYALAIARELNASDMHAVGELELPIPRTLADAIARRLDRLDPRATDPLLVVSALSNPTLSVIQSVLPGFTLSDLDSAEQAEVIEVAGERARFTHPLLSSTMYGLAPASRRRELHRMLAEVVTDEEERAHHLALGAEAPDRGIAVTIEQAAGHAARRGAPEVAAELLEQAARLTPAGAAEAKRARVVAAAEQHVSAGELVRSRSLLEMVLDELPEGPLRARALRQLGQLRSDDFEVAAALFEEALAEAGDHHRVAAEIEALLAENLANRGDHDAAVEHAKAAIARAELTGDLGLLAQMLAGHGVMAFFHGEGIQDASMARAIELEDHAEDTRSYSRPSMSLGSQLFWSDQVEAARPLYERSLRRAIERGEEYDRVAILFHLAHLEWEAGRSEVAERLTAEMIEAQRHAADAQADSYLLWLQAFVAARHGDLTEARARAADAVEVAGRIGDYFIVSFSTSIIAAVELWTGEAAAAHERLPPLREALEAAGGGFIGQLTLPFWSVDIEALISLGRLEEADEVLRDLFARASAAQNPNAIAIAHRCRGLLLAARGGSEAAIDEMDDALTQHALRPLPLEIGRTLLEKGTLERRVKRKSAAKQSLEQALSWLEPLAAAMWVDRARDELGRVGLRRGAASEGLTPAQQRVAELVVAGMSNREIADTLFMSVRTVETHLTKVYQELGVKGRAQLIAKLSATSSR